MGEGIDGARGAPADGTVRTNDGDRLALVERRLDGLEERLRLVGVWGRGIDEHLGRTAVSGEPRGQEVGAVAAPARIASAPPQAASRPTPSPPAPGEQPPADVPPIRPLPNGRAKLPSSPPPPPVAPAWSLGELEQLLSGRALAWIGGLAILLGALFFLGLAFTRGWISPALRVGIGAATGAALIAGGARCFARREALFGHVTVATGLGIASMSLVAATRLYNLLPVEVGLAGALLVAGAAAAIAVRVDSQTVAAYGLLTALAAPPLLGAAPTPVTLAFLTAAIIGTTAVALRRAWGWLPSLAFLLAAPQLALWVRTDAPLAGGLAAVGGFWVLNALAAGGEEFRRRAGRLRPTSATLLVANAAFVVWGGFATLDGPDTVDWRGAFLVAVACAHFLLGGFFLRGEGDRHPFGLLAAGTGLAALTLAVPIQLGGPVVPLAWAAEAVALAWVWARRDHRYSGAWALVLGALAIGHLLAFEYPVVDVTRGFVGQRPFLHAAGGTLGFFLGALAVAAFLARSRPVRAALATAGVLLVTYALPFDLSGLALLTGWATLFVAALALGRLLTPAVGEENAGGDLARSGLSLAAALAAGLTTGHAMLFELPLERFTLRSATLPATPFIDGATLAAGVLIVASLLGGFVAGRASTRRGAVVVAAVIAAYLMPFELRPPAVVVGWSALALALCAVERRDRSGATAYLGATAGLLGLALAATLVVIAPPDRLVVRPGLVVTHPPLWNGAGAALGALIVALAIIARAYRAGRAAGWLAALAGALTVYLLSVGTIDEFGRGLGRGIALAELRKGAQVSLSILWATLGGGAFVAGVARWRAGLRAFGLALLALATAKVFLVDLASLDAVYKVPSFIGLGLLLLTSSYVYQRLKPQEDGGAPATPTGSTPS